MRSMRSAKKSAIQAIQSQQTPAKRAKRNPPDKSATEADRNGNDSSNSAHSLRSTVTVAAVGSCGAPTSPNCTTSRYFTSSETNSHRSHLSSEGAETQPTSAPIPILPHPPHPNEEQEVQVPFPHATEHLESSSQTVIPTDPRRSGINPPAVFQKPEVHGLLSDLASLTQICLKRDSGSIRMPQQSQDSVHCAHTSGVMGEREFTARSSQCELQGQRQPDADAQRDQTYNSRYSAAAAEATVMLELLMQRQAQLKGISSIDIMPTDSVAPLQQLDGSTHSPMDLCTPPVDMYFDCTPSMPGMHSPTPGRSPVDTCSPSLNTQADSHDSPMCMDACMDTGIDSDANMATYPVLQPATGAATALVALCPQQAHTTGTVTLNNVNLASTTSDYIDFAPTDFRNPTCSDIHAEDMPDLPEDSSAPCPDSATQETPESLTAAAALDPVACDADRTTPSVSDDAAVAAPVVDAGASEVLHAVSAVCTQRGLSTAVKPFIECQSIQEQQEEAAAATGTAAVHSTTAELLQPSQQSDAEPQQPQEQSAQPVSASKTQCPQGEEPAQPQQQQSQQQPHQQQPPQQQEAQERHPASHPSHAARRSAREKKLSAKATAAAEQNVLEKQAQEASHLVAARDAANVLLDMSMWGEDMHDVHALHKDHVGRTQPRAAAPFYLIQGLPNMPSMHAAPKTQPKQDKTKMNNVNPLEFLTDIALSVNSASLDGIQQLPTSHRYARPLKNARKRKHNPLMFAAHNLCTVAPLPADPTVSAAYDAVLEPLQLEWGVRQPRSNPSSRRPRCSFGVFVSGMLHSPLGPEPRGMKTRKRRLQIPPSPSQQPIEHTTKPQPPAKQARAGSSDPSPSKPEGGVPTSAVPAAETSPGLKCKAKNSGLGPVISKEQAEADQRERQLSPKSKAAAVAKAAAAAAAAAAAVTATAAPSGRAPYPHRSTSSRSTKTAAKLRIEMKSSSSSRLAHNVSRSGASVANHSTGGSPGTAVSKSRVHSQHAAPARSKMPIRRKAALPVRSYGQ